MSGEDPTVHDSISAAAANAAGAQAPGVPEPEPVTEESEPKPPAKKAAKKTTPARAVKARPGTAEAKAETPEASTA